MLINIIKTLGLIPVYLRFIPNDVFGGWLAFTGVVNILAIADLGLNTLLLQKTASLYGAQDKEKLGCTIVSSLMAVAFLGALVFLPLFALLPWLVSLLQIKSSSEALLWAFRLAVLDTMLTLFVLGLIATLQGMQRPTAPMVGLICGQIVGIGLTLIALWSGWGVLAIPLGMLSGTLLTLGTTGVTLWLTTRKLLPRGFLRLESKTLKELLRSSSILFLARLSGLVTLWSSGPIIAGVLSAPLVVVFEVTRKASLAVQDVVSRIPQSLLPGLTHVVGAGQKETFAKVVHQLLRLTFLATLLGTGGIILLNRDFVGLWTGNQYYGGDGLNILISLYLIVRLMSGLFYNIIMAAGMLSAITVAYFCEGALQISLAIVLGYAWGLEGIATAAVVASLASLVIQASYGAKLLPEPLLQTKFLKPLARSSAVIVLALGLGWLMKSIWPVQGWWRLAVFGVNYLGCGFLLILLVDREIRQLVFSVAPWVPMRLRPSLGEFKSE